MSICDTQVLSGFPPLPREVIVDVVKLCWEKPHREVQLFGIEVAKKYKKSLAGEDVVSCLDGMDLAKFMVTNKSWWDTVDIIASHSNSPL